MFFGGKKQVANDASNSSSADDANTQLPSKPKQLAAGGVIGIASAIFGIGGGSLTVPYLTRYGVVMQKAVGTWALVVCRLPLLASMGLCSLGCSNELMCLTPLALCTFMPF